VPKRSSTGSFAATWTLIHPGVPSAESIEEHEATDVGRPLTRKRTVPSMQQVARLQHSIHWPPAGRWHAVCCWVTRPENRPGAPISTWTQP